MTRVAPQRPMRERISAQPLPKQARGRKQRLEKEQTQPEPRHKPQFSHVRAIGACACAWEPRGVVARGQVALHSDHLCVCSSTTALNLQPSFLGVVHARRSRSPLAYPPPQPPEPPSNDMPFAKEGPHELPHIGALTLFRSTAQVCLLRGMSHSWACAGDLCSRHPCVLLHKT